MGRKDGKFSKQRLLNMIKEKIIKHMLPDFYCLINSNRRKQRMHAIEQGATWQPTANDMLYKNVAFRENKLNGRDNIALETVLPSETSFRMRLTGRKHDRAWCRKPKNKAQLGPKATTDEIRAWLKTGAWERMIVKIQKSIKNYGDAIDLRHNKAMLETTKKSIAHLKTYVQCHHDVHLYEKLAKQDEDSKRNRTRQHSEKHNICDGIVGDLEHIRFPSLSENNDNCHGKRHSDAVELVDTVSAQNLPDVELEMIDEIEGLWRKICATETMEDQREHITKFILGDIGLFYRRQLLENLETSIGEHKLKQTQEEQIQRKTEAEAKYSEVLKAVDDIDEKLTSDDKEPFVAGMKSMYAVEQEYRGICGEAISFLKQNGVNVSKELKTYITKTKKTV